MPLSQVRPRPAASLPERPAAECRCLCGALLARIVPGGVEIKCRRCHRAVIVPLAEPAPA